MAKGKLSQEQQTFVVQALACFDTPSVVCAALKKEFGVTVTVQAIEVYDPNKRAGRNLSEKWKALFEETRKAFLEDTAQIGISHKSVRLRAIQRMADKAETMGNMALAAQLHEQAAKEVGEAYTNRRLLEHSGPGGGAIRHEVTSARDILASKLAGISAGAGAPEDTGEPD